MLDIRLCPEVLVAPFGSCRTAFSVFCRGSNGGRGGTELLGPEPTDPALRLSVFPMTSKYETGTKPRAVGISGLHASYQSSSSSRLITWKKSPLANASFVVSPGSGS